MAKAATKKTPIKTEPEAPKADPNLEIFDFEQGSDDWHKVRVGVITASNLSKVMAKGEGKTREDYLDRIVGERKSQHPVTTYKNTDMERGTVMEPEIREMYRAQTFDEMKQIGFGKRKLPRVTIGASPDCLVGENGGVEFKSMNQAGMVKIFRTGRRPPPEHRAQIQGNMLVFGRQWWDLVIGYSGMPLLKWRFERQEADIEAIIRECEIFDLDARRLLAELDKL